MVERGRGDDEIGLRKGVSCLTALLDQEPPFEHDVLGDGEHALFEHRPYLVGEPVVQFNAARSVGEPFDTEADLGEGDRTDVELLKPLRRNKGEDLRLGLGAAQQASTIASAMSLMAHWRATPPRSNATRGMP